MLPQPKERMIIHTIQNKNREIVKWARSREGMHHDPETIKELEKFYVIGEHTWHCTVPPTPIRFMSPESLLKRRITKITNRIKAKYPLIWREILEQELKKKCYTLEDCQEEHARRIEFDRCVCQLPPEDLEVKLSV